jgi:hypothetical protein
MRLGDGKLTCPRVLNVGASSALKSLKQRYAEACMAAGSPAYGIFWVRGRLSKNLLGRRQTPLGIAMASLVPFWMQLEGSTLNAIEGVFGRDLAPAKVAEPAVSGATIHGYGVSVLASVCGAESHPICAGADDTLEQASLSVVALRTNTSLLAHRRTKGHDDAAFSLQCVRST